MALVELLEQVELLALLVAGQRGVVDVGHQLVDVHVGGDDAGRLVLGGQEAVAPERRADDDLGCWGGARRSRAGSRSRVPSPYSSHDPIDGRIGWTLPVCICSRAGSWFGTSVCIERMTQQSSITCSRCGSVSLTSMPLWPHFSNVSGDGMKPLPLLFL